MILKKITSIVLFIFTFFLVYRTTTIIEIPGALYYASLFFIFSVTIFASLKSKIHLNTYTLVYLLFVLVSIAFNFIPDEFSPTSRFFAYFILVVGIGPVFSSKIHYYIVNKIFIFSIFYFITIIIISLKEINSGGFFEGITNQSMVMGPIAGFVLIVSFIYLKDKWSKLTKFYKISIIILLLISFIELLTSSSRSAIASALLGLIFYLFYSSKNIIKFIQYLFLMIAILVLSYPLWSSKLEGINDKIEMQERMQGDNSRTDMWNSRIAEFKSSPIIGIGFSNVLKDSTGYKGGEDGVVELGSSWLGLLSQLGLVGLLSFLLLFTTIFIKLLRKKTKKNNRTTKHILLSILVFFSVHLLFESYLLASGSLMSLFFWLTMGYSNNYIRNTEKL